MRDPRDPNTLEDDYSDAYADATHVTARWLPKGLPELRRAWSLLKDTRRRVAAIHRDLLRRRQLTREHHAKLEPIWAKWLDVFDTWQTVEAQAQTELNRWGRSDDRRLYWLTPYWRGSEAVRETRHLLEEVARRIAPYEEGLRKVRAREATR